MERTTGPAVTVSSTKQRNAQPVSSHGSMALVSSYPASSGIGTYDSALIELGLYSADLLFSVDRSRVEHLPRAGRKQIRSGVPTPEIAYALSTFGIITPPGELRQYKRLHVTSPELFHLARRRSGVVGTVHDLYPVLPGLKSGYSLSYRTLFRHNLAYVESLAGVIAVSHATGEQLSSLYPGVQPQVIHNWTSEEFRPRNKQEARSQLGLPADEFLVLNVSSDAPSKGIGLLQTIARRLSPTARVLRLAGLARGPAIGGHVTEIHRVVPPAQFPLYYNAADIYLATSSAEGFGRPLIEATNSGTPVVAPKLPVFREVLCDSPYLIPGLELDATVEAILKLAGSSELARAQRWYADRIGDHYRAGRGLREMQSFLESL